MNGLVADPLNSSFSIKPHIEVVLRISFFSQENMEHRQCLNLSRINWYCLVQISLHLSAHYYVVRLKTFNYSFFLAPFLFGGKCKLFRRRTNSIWIKTWFITYKEEDITMDSTVLQQTKRQYLETCRAFFLNLIFCCAVFTTLL